MPETVAYATYEVGATVATVVALLAVVEKVVGRSMGFVGTLPGEIGRAHV